MSEIDKLKKIHIKLIEYFTNIFDISLGVVNENISSELSEQFLGFLSKGYYNKNFSETDFLLNVDEFMKSNFELSI